MVFVTTFLIGKILRFNDFEFLFEYEKVKEHRWNLRTTYSFFVFGLYISVYRWFSIFTNFGLRSSVLENELRYWQAVCGVVIANH